MQHGVLGIRLYLQVFSTWVHMSGSCIGLALWTPRSCHMRVTYVLNVIFSLPIKEDKFSVGTVHVNTIEIPYSLISRSFFDLCRVSQNNILVQCDTHAQWSPKIDRAWHGEWKDTLNALEQPVCYVRLHTFIISSILADKTFERKLHGLVTKKKRNEIRKSGTDVTSGLSLTCNAKCLFGPYL